MMVDNYVIAVLKLITLLLLTQVSLSTDFFNSMLIRFSMLLTKLLNLWIFDTLKQIRTNHIFYLIIIWRCHKNADKTISFLNIDRNLCFKLFFGLKPLLIAKNNYSDIW